MKTIYLVRHGQYDGDTLELDEFGKKQAKLAGEKIKEDLGDSDFFLYSSYYKRACQTASIAFEGKEVLQLNSFGDYSVNNMLKDLEDIKSKTDFAVIVSHEPNIEDLIKHLFREYVNVPKGSIFKIIEEPNQRAYIRL